MSFSGSDDFLSHPFPSESASLSINAAFAAHFNAGAARAAEQRKAALVASALVPGHVLRAFTIAISKAAAAEAVAVPPAQIVAEVVARHQLKVADGPPPAAAAAPSASASAELDRFLGAGPGRAAVAKLLRWARAAAYKVRAALPTPPAEAAAARSGERTAMDAPQSGTSALRRKRARDNVTDGESPEGPSGSRAARTRTPAAAGAIADCGGIAASSRKAPPQPPRRGRGIGRGRLLLDCGEPPFEAMHPSWRAKRILAAREAKAIRRDLKEAV
jgi:hypothetical protein